MANRKYIQYKLLSISLFLFRPTEDADRKLEAAKGLGNNFNLGESLAHTAEFDGGISSSAIRPVIDGHNPGDDLVKLEVVHLSRAKPYRETFQKNQETRAPNFYRINTSRDSCRNRFLI